MFEQIKTEQHEEILNGINLEFLSTSQMAEIGGINDFKSIFLRLVLTNFQIL